METSALEAAMALENDRTEKLLAEVEKLEPGVDLEVYSLPEAPGVVCIKATWSALQQRKSSVVAITQAALRDVTDEMLATNLVEAANANLAPEVAAADKWHRRYWPQEVRT